jgi:hypothetical protein
VARPRIRAARGPRADSSWNHDIFILPSDFWNYCVLQTVCYIASCNAKGTFMPVLGRLDLSRLSVLERAILASPAWGGQLILISGKSNALGEAMN